MAKKTITLALFLGIVAAISGIAIGATNELTKDIIAETAEKQEKANLEQMYPGANFTIVDYDDDLDIEGAYKTDDGHYIIKVGGYGYSSTEIICLVGFDEDLTIDSVIALQQQETKGFGSRVFDNLDSLYVGKTINEKVDSLSGATVTSKAMKKMMSAAQNAVKTINWGN